MTSVPIVANTFSHVLVASPSTMVRKRVLENMRSPARLVQASGGAEALDHLERDSWQVVFLDRCLPDLDAEELSQTVRRRFPSTKVVLVDAEHEPDTSTLQPDSTSEEQFVEPALAQPDAAEWASEASLPGMVGNSAKMRILYRLARLVAPRNTTILITGPSGSGKELVARSIHQLSPRAGRPLIVVNCAAIPETLLESELFGYSRGAFTGAMQSYAGRIQGAQGGTLFLDEIGEMPLSLQPKLLRFLEQKEIQRLGSTDVVRVDTRVVTATNANLLTLVREGRFRADLYYRLSTFPLEIPPLCERMEDIIPLASHFLEKLASRTPVPSLSLTAAQLLQRQPWPGNVRELQNTIERALILAEEAAVIRAEHLQSGDGLPVPTR